MANTNTYVTTGSAQITGGIYVAATTANLPTDATSSLSGFTSLGYVGEDGLEVEQSRDTTAVKSWDGGTVRNLQTSYEETFKFKLIESINVDVLKAVYGSSNVTVDSSGNISIATTPDALPEKAWVFEMKTLDDAKWRIVVPKGQITSIDAIAYKNDEPIAYSVTVTGSLDSRGKAHYEYIEAAEAESE